MNRKHLHDLTRGQYGRKIAYVNANEVTEANVLKILSEGYSVFTHNLPIIKYLWDYKKGDQPALYRVKVTRDDIPPQNVVENHAWEIVNFKNGQTNGEPIQCYSLRKEENVNKWVDKFNDYRRASHKHARDISCGEWVSAVGYGFEAVQRTAEGSEVPFRIAVPSPMNTFMVFSSTTGEPLLAVQELKDLNEERYFLCYSDTREFIIKNSALVPVTDSNGMTVLSKLHAFGGIPIVMYFNNQDCVSDIELVITMLDAINDIQSNRTDAIANFVQSWVKFVNCEVDPDAFQKMKLQGALVVKSNNGKEVKADVDVIAQELKQTETQVAKEDIWDSALSILAIPQINKGSDGGSTQGAVSLRSGWDFAKQRAKLKDPYTTESEKRLCKVMLNVIRIAKGSNVCPLSEMDYDVQINHSPQDNMQVKATVLKLLLEAGIHPLICIKVCGLWGDAEKVFLLSKPYLDVLYKTIDEIPDKEEQEKKAQEIVNNFNKKQNEAATQ